MRRRFRIIRLNDQVFAVPQQTTVPPGVVDGVLIDPQAYFFWLIDREPDQPADDWYSVLSTCGLPPGLPPNVYPVDNGYYGLTQQIRSTGEVAGRIFLPTAVPDDLGYYAHPISPLKDAPQGGGHLLWEWRSLGGPPYVPVHTSDNGGEVPVPPGNLEQRLETIEAELANHEGRITQLEQHPTTGIQFGDKIALRASGGMVIGTAGEVTEPEKPVTFVSNDAIHAWESFTLEKGE